ncbi:hypothetical protein [Streptomyces griseocarneus]|nr:hypothetical protein [Streptomyces griseocarneus]
MDMYSALPQAGTERLRTVMDSVFMLETELSPPLQFDTLVEAA